MELTLHAVPAPDQPPPARRSAAAEFDANGSALLTGAPGAGLHDDSTSQPASRSPVETAALEAVGASIPATSVDEDFAAIRRARRGRWFAPTAVVLGVAAGLGWLVLRRPAPPDPLAHVRAAAAHAAAAPLILTTISRASASPAPAAVAAPSAASDDDAPGLKAAFAQALKPEEGFVVVTVRSEPPGAMLFVNDVTVGTGVAEVKVRRGGQTQVLALLDRHTPARVTIDDSKSTVTIPLPALAAGGTAPRPQSAPPTRSPAPRAAAPATPPAPAAAPMPPLAAGRTTPSAPTGAPRKAEDEPPAAPPPADGPPDGLFPPL